MVGFLFFNVKLVLNTVEKHLATFDYASAEIFHCVTQLFYIELFLVPK
jgi:hypothetical protein